MEKGKLKKKKKKKKTILRIARIVDVSIARRRVGHYVPLRFG